MMAPSKSNRMLLHLFALGYSLGGFGGDVMMVWGSEEMVEEAEADSNDNTAFDISRTKPPDETSSSADGGFKAMEIQDFVCDKQEDGEFFKCEFRVTPKVVEDEVEPLQANDFEISQTTYCHEDNVFCIHASLFDPLLESSGMIDQDLLDDLFDEAFDDILDQVEDDATADSADAATASTTAAKPLSVTPLINQLYPPPYSQYGPDVQWILQEWISAAQKGKGGGGSEDIYETAEWLHQLGVVHRNQAEVLHSQADEGQRDDSQLASIQKHVNLAVRAFRQSLQYYGGLEIDSTQQQEDTWFDKLKQMHMAIAYFNLAEALSLSTETKESKLATDYFVQSSQLFSNHKALLFATPPTFEAMKTQFPYVYAVALRSDGVLDEEDDDPSMKSFWREARLAWAQGCNRAGLLELSAVGLDGGGGASDTDEGVQNFADLQAMAVNVLQSSLVGGADMSSNANLQAATSELEGLLQEQLPKLLVSTERAESYFQQSVDVFRKVLEDGEEGGKNDAQTLKLLGTTMQNMGTALMSKGDLARGTKFYEEALETSEKAVSAYQSLLQRSVGDENKNTISAEQSDLNHAIGEVLYSLSDCYLQQGNYEASQQSYERAMDWFDKHKLDPSGPADTGGSMDEAHTESIQEYERVLEEYHEMFSGDGGGAAAAAAAEMDEEGVYYQQDDGYEADLHSGLGALYMSAGENHLMEAMVHISQAVRLYTRNGEQGERHFADVKSNQAMILFRQREYAESAKARREALELYRHHTGDGVNPLMDGMDMVNLQSMVEEAQREAKLKGDQNLKPEKGRIKNGETEVSAEGTASDAADSIRMGIHPLLIPDEGAESNETDADVLLNINAAGGAVGDR